MSEGGLSEFSLLGFTVAVVTVGAGAAAGLVLVPLVGSYLGILLGGFVTGIAIEDRPLLEAGSAAVLAGLGILAAGGLIGNGLGAAVTAVLSVALPTLLVTVVLSFAVGAFGAHFGDDVREGLTDPVETTGSGTTDTRVPAASVAKEEDHEERVEKTTDDADINRSDTPSERPETTDDREMELERE